MPRRIAYYFKIELNQGHEASWAMQRIHSDTILHLTQGIAGKQDKQQEILESMVAMLQSRPDLDPEIKASYMIALQSSLRDIREAISRVEQTTQRTEQITQHIAQKMDDLQVRPGIRLEMLPATPVRNARFFGREEQILEIDRLLADSVPLALMNGISGIGKSCLACEYVERHKAAYKYRAWISMPQNGSFEEELVSKLHAACGIDLRQYPERAEQFAQVMNVLASSFGDGEGLLVIDNANDLEQLERHLHHFEACRWKVIVTTQCEPQGYSPVTVEELPDDECRSLFLAYYRGNGAAPMSEAEEVSFVGMLGRLHRNSQMLEMMGKIGSTQQYSIDEMLRMLREADIHHPDLNIKVKIGNHAVLSGAEQQARLENYIHSMFRPEALPDSDKELLCCVAVLPPEEFEAEKLLRLFGAEGDAARGLKEQLTQLAAAGWLKRKAVGGRVAYRMHGLVQSVAEAKLHPTHENTGRMIAGFKQVLPLTLDENWDLLDDVYHAFEKLDAHPVVMFFGIFLGDRYRDIGNPERAITIFQRAERIYGQDGSDGYQHALTYERLGDLYQSLGDTGKALEYFEQQTKLFEELYDANPRSESLKNGLAISYSKLGDLYQSLGDTGKALEYFEQDLKLTEELYDANPRSESLKNGLAISYSKLGDLYQSLGDTGKALEYFEKRKQLGEELSASNPRSVELAYGLFAAYWRVAAIYELNKDYKTTLAYLRLALPLIEKLSTGTPIPKYKEWHERLLKEITRIETLL